VRNPTKVLAIFKFPKILLKGFFGTLM